MSTFLEMNDDFIFSNIYLGRSVDKISKYMSGFCVLIFLDLFKSLNLPSAFYVIFPFVAFCAGLLSIKVGIWLQ